MVKLKSKKVGDKVKKLCNKLGMTKEDMSYIIDGPVILNGWLYTFEVITVERAQRDLEGGVANRGLRRRSIRNITEDMVKGRFQTTHQGLAYNEDNELSDGQHRLWAVINSGEPQIMQVTRNVPQDLFYLMDQTSKRTAKDIYTLRQDTGEKYASRVVTVARYVLEGADAHNSSKFRDFEVVEFASMIEEKILDYVTLFAGKDFRGVFSGGWVGALVTASIIYGKEKVDPLVKRLKDLEFKGDKDPMKTLYKYINSKGGGVKFKHNDGSNVSSGQIKWAPRSYVASSIAITAAIHNKGLSKIVPLKNNRDFKGIEKLREKFTDAIRESF